MASQKTLVVSHLGLFDNEVSKDAFGRGVWPGVETNQQTPLIRHYQRCCNFAFICGEPVAEQPNSVVAASVEAIRANKDHEEVLKLAIDMIHHGHHDSANCADEDQKIAEHIIAIAFMVALMCNVGFGHVRPEPTNPNLRQLIWDEDTSKTLILKAFPKVNNLDGKGRLPRTFHARNLERLGSIQVVWTNNLLDHLRLHDPAEEGRPYTVTVFHYAQFLQANVKNTIFPVGLISETLRTLALLFPGHVGGTIGWFQKQQRYNKDLDMSTCFCTFSDNENRTIQSFSYWRDRIAILKQTYDESEPKTVWQWWNDGRKQERWATFWVAIIVLILTVFFGVSQTIEGAIQVYKAYHPA